MKKFNTHVQNSLYLCESIESHGYEALLVGGAVRDIISNVEVNDADIATNMPIHELEKYYRTSSNNDILKQ